MDKEAIPLEFGGRWSELDPLQKALVRGYAITQKIKELHTDTLQVPPGDSTVEALYLHLWPDFQNNVSELFEKAREEGAVEGSTVERQKAVESAMQQALRKKIALELAKQTWHGFEVGPGAEITKADKAQADHDRQERWARIAGPSFDAKVAPFKNLRSLRVAITRTRQPGRQIDSYQVTLPDYQKFLRPLQDKIVATEEKVRELRKPLPQPWWSQGLEATRLWTDVMYWNQKKERRKQATAIEDSGLAEAEGELKKITAACEQLPRVLSEDLLHDDHEQTAELFGSKNTIMMPLGEIFNRLRALAVQAPQPYEEPPGLSEIRARKSELISEIGGLESDFKQAMVSLRLADNLLMANEGDIDRFKQSEYMSLDRL